MNKEQLAAQKFEEWYAKEFARELNQKDHLSKEWTRKAWLSSREAVVLPEKKPFTTNVYSADFGFNLCLEQVKRALGRLR